ncbi:MAG: UbiX family flavin prenyltransferase [Thermoprotei archaeon]
MKLVVGLSGGSGIVYGVRFLQVLRELNIETHLIFTAAAKKTLVLETDYSVSQVEALATRVYGVSDISAAPSSGSFKTDGMVVIPCSMKTLAGIASGYADNLLLRAADVTLKERRPLILVLRETPLNIIHLENMLRAARAGAIIAPAMPAFYHRPKTIDDLLDHQIGKVLDLLGIEHNLFERWEGPQQRKE